MLSKVHAMRLFNGKNYRQHNPLILERSETNPPHDKVYSLENSMTIFYEV